MIDIKFLTAAVWAASAGLLPLSVGAHEGHGDAPVAAGSAAPRFEAASAGYELVGVLQGRQLALYLDQAGDNRPVEGAQLALALNGQPVAVQARGLGEFVAPLAAALPEGEVKVAATVTVGAQGTPLSAALDLHHDEEAAATHTHGLEWGAAAAAVAVLGALAWGWRRRVRVAGGAA